MFNVYEEFDPDYVIEIDGKTEWFHTEEEYTEFIRIKKINRLKNIIYDREHLHRSK